MCALEPPARAQVLPTWVRPQARMSPPGKWVWGPRTCPQGPSTAQAVRAPCLTVTRLALKPPAMEPREGHCSPHCLSPPPRGRAPRLPGEGPVCGRQASGVFGCPRLSIARVGAYRNENLSTWGGQGGPEWQAAGRGLLCCLPASAPFLPSSWDPGLTHQGQGGWSNQG